MFHDPLCLNIKIVPVQRLFEFETKNKMYVSTFNVSHKLILIGANIVKCHYKYQ